MRPSPASDVLSYTLSVPPVLAPRVCSGGLLPFCSTPTPATWESTLRTLLPRGGKEKVALIPHRSQLPPSSIHPGLGLAPAPKTPPSLPSAL